VDEFEVKRRNQFIVEFFCLGCLTMPRGMEVPRTFIYLFSEALVRGKEEQGTYLVFHIQLVLVLNSLK